MGLSLSPHRAGGAARQARVTSAWTSAGDRATTSAIESAEYM
jgi:hypothetical protein